MAENLLTPDFMTGEWRTVGLEWLSGPSWWRFNSPLTFGLPWIFREDNALIMYSDYEHTIYSLYFLNHHDRLLSINGFTVTDNDEYRDPVFERYRVEALSPDEVLLYDLEGIAVELDDYCLRMRLKRVPYITRN